MSFGIDFGTTNSAVVVDEEIQLDVGAGRPFPSLVVIHKATGEQIVGPDAKRRLEELACEDYLVIQSVKRHLGTHTEWRADRLYTPEHIAAAIFKGLKRHAEAHPAARGAQLKEAVITIPVGFSPLAREQLRRAADSAGIEVKGFVSEPTAAYFRYRQQLPECRHVAVFDWGGGTLDVSVLRIEGGTSVHELAIETLQKAGDDIDERIADWVHTRLMKVHPGLLPFEQISHADLVRLRNVCENAKCRLSNLERTAIQLRGYMGKTINEDFTRAQLNRLAAPLLEQAKATFFRALQRSGVRPEDLDKVLLVGGSSRLIAVQEYFCEQFRAKVPAVLEDPDWAVAQGASQICRHNQPGLYKPMQDIALMLSDDTPLSLIRSTDVFDDQEREIRLGVVEETRCAQLVFKESWNGGGLRPIFGISVPVQGFHREIVQLRTSLTRNLTFRARAVGASMRESDGAEYEYERVRFKYQLPVAQGRS